MNLQNLMYYTKSLNFLSSVLEGNNAEVFIDVLHFFAPPPKKIVDLTCGYGKFYEQLSKDEYDLTRCDIRQLEKIDFVIDCSKTLPFENETFDVIVMDPPYQHVGKNRWKRKGEGIFHEDYSKIPNQDYMMTLFNDKEINRILKKTGILIIKIMDMIECSKPIWNHIKILKHLPSFRLEDLIIYKFRAIQDPKWKNIYHARKCHAYFLIFVKKNEKWRRL